MNKKKSKIQIYYVGNNDSLVSRIYINNLIKFLKTNKKFDLKCIVNTEFKNRSYITKLRKKLILLVYFFFNRNYYKHLKLISVNSNYLSFAKQAVSNNISFQNYENFLNQKIEKNSMLLSCGGMRIFKRKLLKKFETSINYHHALLPQFRGVYSNGLEIFYNKNYSYFSWHYINTQIDRGYIFYKNKIRINKPLKHMIFYDLEKINLASKKIKKILTLAIKSKKKLYSPKKGHYYSKSYFDNYFNNLKKFKFEQIKKFITIFGGFVYNGMFVTKIKKSHSGISLADCKIKICEIKYLPIFIYKIFKFFNQIN